MSEPVTSAPQSDRKAAETVEGEVRRTDPRSFVVQTLSGMRSAAFPVLAMLFLMRDEGAGILPAILVGVAIIGLAAVRGYLSWKKFTYQLNAEDIRVEYGIISRAARSVPFERIQDVSLEQALLPRLFGLVEVRFETGAGGKDELKIAYLTQDEGRALREAVRERIDEEAGESAPALADDNTDTAASSSHDQAVSQNGETLFRMGPPRLFRFGMFEFSLAVVAVFFAATQQLDFLLPFEVWDPRAWQEQFAGPGAWLASLGPLAQITGGVFAMASLVVVGVVTGLVRTFLRDWGFVLEKTSRGFRRRRGLLTRTDVVMPVHRVQALTIGTRILRYRFGWHGLTFVSLAQDSGSSNHVVAPFAKLDEIAPIVERAGFAMPSENADWHRASTRYRLDSVLVESGIFLLLAIPVAIFAPPAFAAIPIALAVLTALANLYAWKFHRHALDGAQIVATRGLFAPRTQIARRVKLHSVELSQGPIAQRRGYAALELGLAGGSLSVPGLPIERARALRMAILESITATDFSRLETA